MYWLHVNFVFNSIRRICFCSLIKSSFTPFTSLSGGSPVLSHESLLKPAVMRHICRAVRFRSKAEDPADVCGLITMHILISHHLTKTKARVHTQPSLMWLTPVPPSHLLSSTPPQAAFLNNFFSRSHIVEYCYE